jgi:hypothetical protein
VAYLRKSVFHSVVRYSEPLKFTTYFNFKSVPLEWRTAVGCAELLREQCEHPRQQDHGGHHTDRQAVRNLQVRVVSVLDKKKLRSKILTAKRLSTSPFFTEGRETKENTNHLGKVHKLQ